MNTETEISGWVFSAEEPGEPSDGMVWIILGTTSEVSFNALKKNMVMVYPVSAKQSVSGVWVDKDAKIFQDGAWVQFVANIIVYDTGIENWTLTLENVTRAENYLNAALATNGNASIKTASMDITHHKTVQVEYSNLTGGGTFKGTITVRLLSTDGSKVAETNETSSAAGTITLDVTEDGIFEVHALTKAAAEDLLGGAMAKKVAWLFGETCTFRPMPEAEKLRIPKEAI